MHGCKNNRKSNADIDFNHFTNILQDFQGFLNQIFLKYFETPVVHHTL